MAKKVGKATKRSHAPIKRAKRKRRVWKRFSEGTWFAVPIGKGTWSVGVIARVGARSMTFGYFFGPARRRVPTLEDTRDLTADAAVLCVLFGDLGLQDGSWLVIGEDEEWNPDDWPLPAFGRYSPTASPTSTAVRVVYSDSLERTSERACTKADVEHLPLHRLCGSGYVEDVLADLLKRRRTTDRQG
jgi:hypothetical protein